MAVLFCIGEGLQNRSSLGILKAGRSLSKALLDLKKEKEYTIPSHVYTFD
jgi:hypothetical protein